MLSELLSKQELVHVYWGGGGGGGGLPNGERCHAIT